MRTNQHILKFPVLFFLFLSFLIPAFLIPVTAVGELSGDSPESDKISVENRQYVGGTLSFDAKLSGASADGTLYFAVFEENGRMKRTASLPAQASCAVSLADIRPTDSVRAIWADENYVPIDALTLRMSDNQATAYARFTEKLSVAFKRDGQAPAAASDDNPYGLGRLLVSCGNPSDLEGYGADIIPGPDNLYILQFRTPGEAEQCAEKLKALPSVRYAEPDSVMLAEAEAEARETPEADSHSWGASETALDEYAEYLLRNGKNRKVVVAVVDSGLDTNHPFLQNRALPGFDFVEYDSVPQDPYGHGTHVAGTVVDCTRGLDVQILPVRVLNSLGAGSFLDIALGIRYAADHGADVINLSLTSSADSVTIDDAVRYAVAKNVAVVVAAGNYNRRADAFCPAHMRECVTVAAVDSDLKRYGKSNYGDAVDIAAPGVGIESCVPGGGYVLNSGTSMAAPHVSAAAALLLCERGSRLTPAQIARLLRDAASELPPDRDEPEKRLGAGFLNLCPFIMRTVSFYSQGRLVETRSVPSRSVITLKAPDVSRDGYDFAQWNASADGSGVAYPDGTVLTVTQDMALYAQWEEKGGFYALLYSDGELAFQESRAPRAGKSPVKAYPVAAGDANAQHAAWYQERAQIRAVTFADTVQPLSTASWFHGCENLSEIHGIERLDLSNVTDMSQMFSRCTSLTGLDLTAWDTSGVRNMQAVFFGCTNLAELDLTGWNTANVTDMEDMFNGCAALKTVYASETFTKGAVSNSAGMFGGCTSLPNYDPAHTDKAYARIDGGADNPGYFSDKNAPQPSNDIYAVLYADGELVFQNNDRTDSGRSVMDAYHKINSPYSSSYFVPWHRQREKIETVTFADKIQPVSTAYWFDGCYSLTNVRNIAHLDTSNVINMSYMFSDCQQLAALDVSGFNTANVTNMGSMFNQCHKLRWMYAALTPPMSLT